MKLKETFHDQELWFPAFNYDFTKTRIFDYENDPVQVGAFNELLRKSGEYTRSTVPIFSMLRGGAISKSPFEEHTAPFGDNGDFAELRERNGNIIFLGASTSALTYIHFVETLVQVPYRYEKIFDGKVKFKQEIKNVSIRYLVRPLGIRLEYDWQKIHQGLINAKIFWEIDNLGSYKIYNVILLTEYMVSRYSEDIYWTLKEDSKEIVDIKLQSLGRTFRMSDFESDSINA